MTLETFSGFDSMTLKVLILISRMILREIEQALQGTPVESLKGFGGHICDHILAVSVRSSSYDFALGVISGNIHVWNLG